MKKYSLIEFPDNVRKINFSHMDIIDELYISNN